MATTCCATTVVDAALFKSFGGHLVSPRIAGYAKAAAALNVCYRPIVYLAYDANKNLTDRQWETLKGLDNKTTERIFNMVGGLVRDHADSFFCTRHVRSDTERAIPMPEIVG